MIPSWLKKRRPIVIPGHLAAGHMVAHAPPEIGTAEAIGRSWTATFEKVAGLNRRSKILDIGCGPGRMAVAIGERFRWRNEYLGFDINPADIDFCRTHIAPLGQDFRFEHYDIANDYYNPKGCLDAKEAKFPASTGSKDFVFATSIFTHFFRDEFVHYVAEARRCVAQNGVFLASFFLLYPEAEAAIIRKDARFTFAHARGDGTRVNNPAAPGKAVAFERDMIMEAFAAAGFSRVDHIPGGWCGVAARHSQDIRCAAIARAPCDTFV